MNYYAYKTMDRIAFGKKTPNSQGARLDRFVAPRDVISDVRRRRKRLSCGQHDNDIWVKKYHQKKKYESYLDMAFGLEPALDQTEQETGLERVKTWPCLPRTRSYLSTADSILDLPNYSDAAFPELLDWSNDNILVAALGRKYHKWSWWSQSIISQGLAQERIQCCKFDPRGELLALGTDMQSVEVHDNMLNKKVKSTVCICLEVDNHVCSITALDWSPTGNSLVTGCSWGIVMSCTRNLQLISWREWKGPILAVRVSPDSRYVAVTSVKSHRIVLMSWPTLEIMSNLYSKSWTVKALTWHPWRSAFLGVGAVAKDNQAQISLWDAPSCKSRDNVIGHSYSLDAMLFSHRTGELVLSLWDTASTQLNSCSQLVVMSDPNTVVDRWGEGRSGLDRVRTMVFNPDGTKLATATTDEDLIIWNFLPDDKKKKKTGSRRFSAIPVYLDETSYGYSVR